MWQWKWKQKTTRHKVKWSPSPSLSQCLYGFGFFFNTCTWFNGISVHQKKNVDDDNHRWWKTLTIVFFHIYLKNILILPPGYSYCFVGVLLLLFGVYVYVGGGGGSHIITFIASVTRVTIKNNHHHHHHSFILIFFVLFVAFFSSKNIKKNNFHSLQIFKSTSVMICFKLHEFFLFRFSLFVFSYVRWWKKT